MFIKVVYLIMHLVSDILNDNVTMLIYSTDPS